MAKIDKLEEKRLNDFLTAQMGLAAEEKTAKAEKKEGCLSSEELADVAANLCTPEQKEKAIEHFASCQACYDEWVSICFSIAAMESGSSGGRAPLVTIRNLGYIGSALAIAACFILFLNIRQNAPQYEVAPQPSSVEKSVVRPAAKKMTANKQERVSEEGVQSAAPSSRSVAGGGADRSLQPEKSASDAVMSDFSAAKPETERPAARPEEVTTWLKKVNEGCRYRYSGPEFWRSLHTEGQRLAGAAGAGFVTELLPLLPESGMTDQIETQCDVILTLLAEDGRTE